MAAVEKSWKELALLLLLSLLWGGSYSLIKMGVDTIPPITFIAARTFIAAAILIAILKVSGIRFPTDRSNLAMFAVQACLNSVVPFTLIAWAEQTVDASVATILNSTSPIFAFLMTAVLARSTRTRNDLVRLVGVVLGLAGTCLVVGPSSLMGMNQQLLGQVAIVLATVCYAGGAVYGRRFAHLNPLVPAAGSMLLGTIILSPIAFVVETPWNAAPSCQSLVALLILSVFSTAVAFTIYFRLVRTLGTLGVTAQAYLRVPFGVLIGAAVFSEQIAATLWVGLILTCLGVCAMTLPNHGKAT